MADGLLSVVLGVRYAQQVVTSDSLPCVFCAASCDAVGLERRLIRRQLRRRLLAPRSPCRYIRRVDRPDPRQLEEF